MAPFEYLLIFAAVILGLAVCEIAIGLNRLLARRVETDRLGLAGALAASPAFLIVPVGLSPILVKSRLWHTIALAGLCPSICFNIGQGLS